MCNEEHQNGQHFQFHGSHFHPNVTHKSREYLLEQIVTSKQYLKTKSMFILMTNTRQSQMNVFAFLWLATYVRSRTDHSSAITLLTSKYISRLVIKESKIFHLPYVNSNLPWSKTCSMQTSSMKRQKIDCQKSDYKAFQSVFTERALQTINLKNRNLYSKSRRRLYDGR